MMEEEDQRVSGSSSHQIVLKQDEDGRSLSDEEIQAEANTFMFAGWLPQPWLCEF